MADTRRTGATIDWGQRLTAAVRQIAGQLDTYALMRSAGRGEAAAEVLGRVRLQIQDLETDVLPLVRNRLDWVAAQRKD